MRIIALVFVVSSWMVPTHSFAKGASAGKGTVSASTFSAPNNKPLSIKGQANRLSMMTVLQNQQDDVNFVRIKQNFKNEILHTNF